MLSTMVGSGLVVGYKAEASYTMVNAVVGSVLFVFSDYEK